MSTYPNQYCSSACRPAWASQSAPLEPPTLPSVSTVALQDIVEGQQRATNGLISLLSQERTSNERGARDHKQQLSNLAALSQNFIYCIPDIEQRFSALESLISVHRMHTDNVDLQDRVKDMAEVVANLRRIAESFASSAGLRLVPGISPSQWAWVPTNTPSLQQGPTSFSANFPQAPRIFPSIIPNSTRSSVFAHSTGPARSVHWPSDLDPPATSWTTPWPDSYYPGPYATSNAPAGFSGISLGGVRGFSTGTGPGTAYATCPPMPPSPYMAPTLSDPSSPLTPMTGRFGRHSPAPTPQMSFGPRSPPLSVPIVEPPHLHRRSLSPQPASTASQTESVVGSMHRTQLSPITESRTPSPAVPQLPVFDCTSLGGPSRSLSIAETLSTCSGLVVVPPSAPRAGHVTTLRGQPDLVVPNDPTRQTLVDMVYPSEPSSTVSSINEFSIPSPPRVENLPLRTVEAVRWSSLFPSAPVVVERRARESGASGLTRVSSFDESNASPLSSPARSVISYVESPKLSSPSEPMTPLSRMTGESTPGAVPNRLTTDVVDKPKESEDSIRSAPNATVGSAVDASTSNVSSSSMLPRNHLAIQLVSFFFESVQRIFKVPASVDLSYNGFEVTFSTASVPWNDASAGPGLADKGGEHDRTFEIMPAPSNTTLHRYIEDLARVRMDLATMQVGENKNLDQAIKQLELRVKAEEETTRDWVRRLCATAGRLSIADPAFSPRK